MLLPTVLTRILTPGRQARRPRVPASGRQMMSQELLACYSRIVSPIEVYSWYFPVVLLFHFLRLGPLEVGLAKIAVLIGG